MVTSFKGNQKLIFEGYRYNIHHIVPAKGVKTWRCVCAKKLTSARSWCKGRAETWDEDSQGVSKGEHNHVAEHDVAELEYFKSQLILAAIAHPTALLNDLIDEAATYMSPGVSFGSRESLKKSLTVARKSAENGGFKLKCYKNSEAKAPKASDVSLIPPDLKFSFTNGTMASLLSLARQCQKNEPKDEDQEDAHSDPSNDQSTSSVSSIFNSFTGLNGNGDYYDHDESAPLAKMAKFEPPESPYRVSPFEDTVHNGNGTPLSSHHFDYGINSPSNRSTPLLTGLPTQVLIQKKNAIDKAIRTARVNDIFNKLSHKAAVAASGSTTTSPETHNTSSSSVGTTSNSSITSSFSKRSIETQTDGCRDGEEIRLSTCLGNSASISGCNCRIIRVCCCSEETCRRGLKRATTS
uniref:FLYWCH-type domain-containing protein n=1 Tax=Acrobeloides nanus TaxID=290746 RepID=A0A914DK78_9BILA